VGLALGSGVLLSVGLAVGVLLSVAVALALGLGLGLAGLETRAGRPPCQLQ